MSIPARRMIAATVALAASLGITACGQRTDKTGTAPLQKVRVSFQPHLSFSPIMIAQEEGFFRDEGLDVELVNALQHEETLVALIAGDLDVRPGPISSGFLSAVSQGAKIRVVADQGYLKRDGCTYFGIVARKGVDTSRPKSITKIRASLDGTSRYVVSRMLEQRGISLSTLETVRLPEAVVGNSLQTGALDAGAVSEPTLSRLAATEKRWLSGQDGAPDFQWGVLSFGDRFLTREPELGVKFLRAFRRAVAQFNEGKTPRNIAIIAKGTDDTPESIAAACWPSYHEGARINWQSIADFQVWAISQGLMKSAVTESQAWDSTFVVRSDSVVTTPTRP